MSFGTGEPWRGAARSSFSQNLSLSGGTPPYTVTVVGGSLPPGFQIISGNALFSGAVANSVFLVGTPLASGPFTFTLEAQDSTGAASARQRTFTMTVARFTLAISTVLPDGAVNNFYSHTLLAWDNAGPVIWSVTPGFLIPAGLTLVGNVLSGTPTVSSANPPVGGSYSFTLDATDPGVPGVVRTQSFSLKVAPVGITDPQVLSTVYVAGSPFTYTFNTTTGGAVAWGVQGGLPTGFSFDTSTGTLGNPAPGAGQFTFNLFVGPAGVNCSTNNICQVRRFTVFVRQQNPTVLDYPYASTALADTTVGQSTTLALGGQNGGLPPYTWVVVGSLPAGLFWCKELLGVAHVHQYQSGAVADGCAGHARRLHV